MGRYEEFVAYREQGMTYKEIAARCGVCHQRVAQVLAHRTPGHFKPYLPHEVVYNGLREWMNENLVSRSDLGRLFNGKANPGGEWASRVNNRLTGRTGWRMVEINKLIDASGLTYEQLFRSGRWCEHDAEV